MSKKPNFIIFLADQLRWDFLGCNGNKIVKTPNIDEIAKTGTINKKTVSRKISRLTKKIKNSKKK